MSETTNEPAGQNNAPDQEAQAHEERKRPLDAFFSSLRQGAERALPRVNAAAQEADYWGGYGLAFAASFVATVVSELTPEPVKKGYREGGLPGSKTARDWSEAVKRGAPTGTATPILLADRTDGPQPGAA